MYSTTGHLAIDVNGNAKPNILGRDVFYFRVGYDGVLYPAGSLNYSILQKNLAIICGIRQIVNIFAQTHLKKKVAQLA